MNYLLALVMAMFISALLTPLVQRLAFRLDAIDLPDPRKIHTKPVARLGGVAIFAGFVFTVAVFWHFDLGRQLGALLLGCTLLLLVGVVDDLRGLSPWVKLVFQILAAGIALSGGIGVISLTNPFGGTISLNWGRFAVSLGDYRFHITPLANALSLLWMVGLINAINFLDGLDGLACGVSGIAACIMFALAIGPHVLQPDVALLSIILAGAAFGFLPYNFYPAKLFMGDSGAYFLGLALALLAIYSGGKLATASLVLGFTIIDGSWTVLRRIYHRTSPFKADRHHLHHLLLDAGLNQRQAVLTLYLVAILFGGVALLSGSFAKLIALVILLVTTVTLIIVLLAVAARKTRLTA